MMLVDPPDDLSLSFLRHAEIGRFEPGHRLSALVDHQHIEQNLAGGNPKRGSFCRRGRGGLTGPDPNRSRRRLRRLAGGKEDDRACNATNNGKQTQRTECGTKRHESPQIGRNVRENYTSLVGNSKAMDADAAREGSVPGGNGSSCGGCEQAVAPLGHGMGVVTSLSRTRISSPWIDLIALSFVRNAVASAASAAASRIESGVFIP
jgi:hypothetical protein